MASFDEYDILVARCGAWSIADLGDLLHEIDRDPELVDVERAHLQDRLYHLIWERAQPLLRRGADDADDRSDDEPRRSDGDTERDSDDVHEFG